MLSSDVRDWKVGDLGRTPEGHCVVVTRIVGNRYLEVAKYACLCDVKHDKRVFIPAHAEIEKFSK